MSIIGPIIGVETLYKLFFVVVVVVVVVAAAAAADDDDDSDDGDGDCISDTHVNLQTVANCVSTSSSTS